MTLPILELESDFYIAPAVLSVDADDAGTFVQPLPNYGLPHPIRGLTG